MWKASDKIKLTQNSCKKKVSDRVEDIEALLSIF